MTKRFYFLFIRPSQLLAILSPAQPLPGTARSWGTPPESPQQVRLADLAQLILQAWKKNPQIPQLKQPCLPPHLPADFIVLVQLFPQPLQLAEFFLPQLQVRFAH
jgi:hypothetical protein